MRGSSTILGIGVLVLGGGALGCAKGEVTRTPDQWRDDIAAQMTPLTEDFRACYVKSKAAWADHAKQMKGGASVSEGMKPKARETILVSLRVESVRADTPKVDVSEGYDSSVPKEERTSDGDLAKCVQNVVKAKIKVPPKLDNNLGMGTWRVVFVADAPSAPPTITKESPGS